jgi:hypothetical protein
LVKIFLADDHQFGNITKFAKINCEAYQINKNEKRKRKKRKRFEFLTINPNLNFQKNSCCVTPPTQPSNPYSATICHIITLTTKRVKLPTSVKLAIDSR